jgi:RNA-directed DNA polymerase
MSNLKEDNIDVNTSGTPQGGVISPLLANIALRGMETELLSKFSRDGVKIIRYADDFVIMSKSLSNIEKAKKIVIDFLSTIGLELSSEKTRIGHSQNVMEQKEQAVESAPGLNLLGFHFRNIRTSIHRGVKTTRGKKQKFKQISTPSRESVKRHKMVIKNILRTHRSAPRLAVIQKLATVIKG